MKRRNFFGLLGKATVIASVTPTLLNAEEKTSATAEYLEDLEFEREYEQKVFKKTLFVDVDHLFLRLYDQNKKEVTYSGYSPIRISTRLISWEIDDEGTIMNKYELDFGQCQDEEETLIRYWKLTTPDGKKIYGGQLTCDLRVIDGCTPVFAPTALQIHEG